METIKLEYEEFKKSHKNTYNISFHIFCGIIFMSFLLLACGTYKNIALIIYSVMLLVTLKDNTTAIYITCILYFLINYIFNNLGLSSFYCIGFFLIFYLLPDLSHYLTKEKTVLTINNVTAITGFVNVFYLLPFSLDCLTDS